MKDRADLKEIGFTGFISVQDLFESNLAVVPREPGVYAFLREDESSPQFLEISSGGHFKDKNPTVDLETLEDNWVPGTAIVYIGKAGQQGRPPTLKTRLRQYLDFGRGKPVGHWGGRYIWQLKNSGELIVCWKVIEDQDPEIVERELITAFRKTHDRLPFANLTKGTKRASL